MEKTKNESDYESLFLKKRASSRRQQVYISQSVCEKISSYLPVIARQITITGYLDNIISHHFAQYKNIINELYDKNYKRPFEDDEEFI